MDKIYVLLASRHIPSSVKEGILTGKFSYEDCIKIGHTKDLKGRLISYRTSIPGFTHLYTIDGGTEEDEKRLHIYFQKYREGKDLNGREWFIYNKKIINFFETHKTIESIREALERKNIKLPRTHTCYCIKDIKTMADEITSIISDVIYNDITISNLSELNSILDYIIKLKTCDLPTIFKCLKKDFGYSENQIKQIEEKFNEEPQVKYLDYLKIFDSKTNFIDKMKYLCEEIKIQENEIKKFFEYIPLSYKSAYLILGPEKLKALGYQRSRIKGEFNIQYFFSNDISQEVHEKFKVGDRIVLTKVKEILQSIYEKNGRKDLRAKASDLEKWFDIKLIKISNKETGKRDRGFEIIKDLSE